MPKKYKKSWMPDYMPSDEERKWYEHGIEKGIRISPSPSTNDPNPKKWHLAVFSRDKWIKSPNVYDENNIWVEYYKAYKFYYDKYR